MAHPTNATTAQTALSKVPQVTAIFWIMKIAATTLGETAGDLLSMTLNIGYAVSTVLLMVIFLVTVTGQLLSKKNHPWLYWLVILATSTTGTTMSDFMDRTLGLGYATGSLILSSLLVAILLFWRFSGYSLSVNDIHSRKVELLYWSAILISNTLGTALGDYLADDSGLGFAGGATLIGSLLLILALMNAYSSVSKITLFWAAFVLTRPFGATMGDVLTKEPTRGGLGLGTIGSSLVLGIILFAFVLYVSKKHHAEQQIALIEA